MAVTDSATPPPGLPSQQCPPPGLPSHQYPPPGLPSQQYPPPLLPKPGKDNARLQKLLKRTAKKKSSTQTSQSTVPFRSSLSPVNEASPDLEHSDHSTPPKTPETPFTLRSIQPAPRFAVRTLYQHVASPYPQRAAYGRARSTSPRGGATPTCSIIHDTSTFSSLSDSPGPGQPEQLTVPRIVPPGAPTLQVQQPASDSLPEVPAGLEPATARGHTQPKPKSPGPTLYSTAGGQVLIRPITVLAPIIKSKSPRPTFRATELSRSPKPLFDVPQIRMYTASTSYYETSRTPPVFDTSALTAIGSMVANSRAATAETKEDEAAREPTPTSQLSSSVTDSQRKAATSDAATGIAPAQVFTPEALTLDVCRASPPPDAKRTTQTAERKRATPTGDGQKAPPVSDMKLVAPLSEVTAKTHTYEFEMSRITAVRPGTPARATTPAFEVPRPNPLLFAVTAFPVEPQRSTTPQTLPDANAFMKVQVPAEVLNKESPSDPTPAAKPELESPAEPNPESELTREMSRAAPPSAVTTSQRPKTPTYEASRLLSTSPGYKRPKTPTYGINRSGVSPQTLTHTTQKSSYRGLTPAEYAAYGGIRTYSPAFGISCTTTPTQDEVDLPEGSKTPSRGTSVTSQAPVKGSKTKEDQLQRVEEKGGSVPTIVVSQASESSDKLGTKETLPHQAAPRQQTTWTQETLKAVIQSAESRPSVKRTTQSPTAELTRKVPEGKRPLCKAGEEDDWKELKELLDKDKVHIAEQEPGKQNNIELPKQKEPIVATTTTSKDSSAGPQLTVKTKTVDGTEKKAAAASAVSPASDKKKRDDPPAAAENLLKVLQKPKGMKSKSTGWSRLKKHMVVEQEEPKFPETGPHRQVDEPGKTEVDRQDRKMADDKAHAHDQRQGSGSPKATKMWDAVLFQMFSSKENIMHQIQLSKSETEQSKENDDGKEIPSFAYRLPVLLFSPKFDAKKLKEAASRPVTKISTVFEMGLIGRKGKEEEPKDFNRTARGFRNV